MGWGLPTGQVKISSVAKKNKKNQDLPEGMSRRQAKLAARAAERAKLQRDARPYAGFAMESDIIALQEFVPSARVKVEVKGIDFPVSLVTVLPGAVAAMRRAAEDGGEGFVALQTQRPGDNPNRDLAYALNWLKSAEPGAALEVGVADGNEPELTNLLDPKADEEIIVEQDFNWWLTEEHQDNPQVAATLRRANDSVLPSEKVRADIKGAAWWIDPGERAHIRWVRPEDENELLNALARVHAAGELNLGEGSKFAGVFRTHGVMVPVWDLDNSWEPQTWQKGLEALDKKIAEALANDSGRFSPEEQKAKQTIVSREVTIR